MAGTLGQAPDDDVSLWRVVAALLVCLVFAVAAALFLKPHFAGSSMGSLLATRKERRLRLVETLRLTNKSDLHIVDRDGREMLILTSEQGTRVIDIADQSPAATRLRVVP